jgi:hypothetical protein
MAVVQVVQVEMQERNSMITMLVEVGAQVDIPVLAAAEPQQQSLHHNQPPDLVAAVAAAVATPEATTIRTETLEAAPDLVAELVY